MPTLTPALERHHPAPQRSAVGRRSLAFALLGAPTAWALQLTLGYGLAAHACFPGDLPLAAPVWTPVEPVLAAISAAAFLLGLAAGWTALRNWRKVRHERPGSHRHLLEAGEGRTRFLAMWGLLTSLMFLLALLFTAFNLLLIPLC
jgi:hypothetical protein